MTLSGTRSQSGRGPCLIWLVWWVCLKIEQPLFKGKYLHYSLGSVPSGVLASGKMMGKTNTTGSWQGLVCFWDGCERKTKDRASRCRPVRVWQEPTSRCKSWFSDSSCAWGEWYFCLLVLETSEQSWCCAWFALEEQRSKHTVVGAGHKRGTWRKKPWGFHMVQVLIKRKKPLCCKDHNLTIKQNLQRQSRQWKH